MKRLCNCIVFTILFTFLPIGARASQLLIPGGQVIGLQLQNDTVTVAAFDDTLGSCAKDAGLCVGDEILSVNGRTVHSAGDIRSALEESGQTASITIRRESKTRQLQLMPRNTADGPRLGVYLKQGIAGIGTITWYDPQTGVFGTLGHGVNDGRGNLAKLRSGSAFPADVLSVKKGTSGSPGQLKGNADANTHWGTLLRNTPQGVFGTARQGIGGEPLPVADYGEISSGAATIRSTVAGSTVQEYSVEILKIYPEDRPDGRNFLLKVTDADLLAATGGIVQGMGVSYNRDNTGTLRSLQGLGDSPGFSLTKKNLCTRAGTQGRTSFVSSDQAIRMKYIERRFYNLSTLIKQPNIILPHRIRHRAVSVTLFGAFCFDWRKL